MGKDAHCPTAGVMAESCAGSSQQGKTFLDACGDTYCQGARGQKTTESYTRCGQCFYEWCTKHPGSVWCPGKSARTKCAPPTCTAACEKEFVYGCMNHWCKSGQTHTNAYKRCRDNLDRGCPQQTYGRRSKVCRKCTVRECRNTPAMSAGINLCMQACLPAFLQACLHSGWLEPMPIHMCAHEHIPMLYFGTQ